MEENPIDARISSSSLHRSKRYGCTRHCTYGPDVIGVEKNEGEGQRWSLGQCTSKQKVMCMLERACLHNSIGR